MNIYRTGKEIVIENDGKFYSVKDQIWDEFINDDHLFEKVQKIAASQSPNEDKSISGVLAPIGNQELWACGVTYFRSKIGRQEESKDAGGGDFYARVYEAERPEVFFKATSHRVVGPNDKVRIRKDSTWDVPEPELTLVVTSSGKIVGYTIGNDMSSRSIEGENPLYLPQAKTYDGCAAVGPCIFVTEQRLDNNTNIHLEINRNGSTVYEGKIAVNQMKRTPEELVSFVFRECSFPYGCLIMTGTGIVPEHDFTLKSGDEIKISIDGIGTLVNEVM
ncbi:fumarylacetoacetate hydrolase family protein [Segetibacter koreensis]|uniref:fumarylacetoacetate hydrolase family protein n=1 Tax=Segetibacter koreensis TaxID=398037 RepID=UPI00035C7A9D|nr:fumarylacetoacetate hydrolase family protein [Segetibacter koreensis]